MIAHWPFDCAKRLHIGDSGPPYRVLQLFQFKRIYIDLWGYCSSSLVNVPRSTMDPSAYRTNNIYEQDKETTAAVATAIVLL